MGGCWSRGRAARVGGAWEGLGVLGRAVGGAGRLNACLSFVIVFFPLVCVLNSDL